MKEAVDARFKAGHDEREWGGDWRPLLARFPQTG
jgi:hypothetical protein